MQIIKQNKIRNKNFIWAVIITLILVLASVVTMYARNLGPFSKTTNEQTEINFSDATAEQKAAGKTIKEQSVSPADETSNSSSEPKATTSISKTVGIEITNLNRSGSNLIVKTLIQEISSSGSCTLTLTQAGKQPITRVVKTQALPSSSTCRGFTVGNLGSGVWNLRIDYSSNKSSGNISRTV
jgi:hypothetical protein